MNLPSRNVIVSFSGGRTSAYMAKRLLDEFGGTHDLRFVFANTGQEDERSLEFVNECDQRWGLGVIWLECVIHEGETKAATHKQVSFETASRSGAPFEAMIRKYGIPNKTWPHCTRELKLNPINSYVRSLNLADHVMCVGIRSDEIHRMKTNFEAEKLFYPLIQLWPTDEAYVQHWWRQQDFDLTTPKHFGNCKTCWKKSLRKLLTVAKEAPEEFEFFDRMEREYAMAGHNEDGKPRRFFRQHMSARDILDASKKPFTPFRDEPIPYQEGFLDGMRLDSQSECEESCEPFGKGTQAA